MTGSLTSTIQLDASQRRVVIIAARFNDSLVDQLIEGATQAWRDHGGEPSRLLLERVPGAFELPLAAKMFAASGGVDAVIALGCVIRGDTPHFEYVAGECARGLMDAVGAERDREVTDDCAGFGRTACAGVSWTTALHTAQRVR